MEGVMIFQLLFLLQVPTSPAPLRCVCIEHVPALSSSYQCSKLKSCLFEPVAPCAVILHLQLYLEDAHGWVTVISSGVATCSNLKLLCRTPCCYILLPLWSSDPYPASFSPFSRSQCNLYLWVHMLLQVLALGTWINEFCKCQGSKCFAVRWV